MIIEFAKFNQVFEDIRHELEREAEPIEVADMALGFLDLIATSPSAELFSVRFDEHRGDILSGSYDMAAFYIAAKVHGIK